MSTHDTDIELPPLPPLYIAPSVEPVDYPKVAQALMDYARAAIEADRKRRGEPVAWLRKNGFRFNAEIEPRDDSELPLYTTPQSAKPLKSFMQRVSERRCTFDPRPSSIEENPPTTHEAPRPNKSGRFERACKRNPLWGLQSVPENAR